MAGASDRRGLRRLVALSLLLFLFPVRKSRSCARRYADYWTCSKGRWWVDEAGSRWIRGSEHSRAELEEGNEGDRRKKGLETSMHPIDPRSAIHLISNVLLLRLLLYARDEESS